ncbi:hypothetical protein J41TS12_37010 [Paenibacillus antibioticophila]|uniref:LRAT domain-containing protein n=2 Tax=Paenibacillus antibioticophila TaxID=1274374 RepID=A0A919XYV0_9BACL|nr:hypothetical protein J41TS12_37010 [Paenibacillus antibioticophila]
MGFFQNLKWFVEGISDANKELAQGVKSDLKQFKTEMKDLVKEHHPKTGEAIEKIDRIAQTIGNAGRSIPIPPTTKHDPFPKFPQLAIFKNDEAAVGSLQRGDHIYVQRVGYEHHALYIGSDRIIHYSKGSVREEGIEGMDDFFNKSEVKVKSSPCTYSKDEIILRAQSRLGESDYNLASNNCEHFVTWCRSGGRYKDTI